MSSLVTVPKGTPPTVDARVTVLFPSVSENVPVFDTVPPSLPVTEASLVATTGAALAGTSVKVTVVAV